MTDTFYLLYAPKRLPLWRAKYLMRILAKRYGGKKCFKAQTISPNKYRDGKTIAFSSAGIYFSPECFYSKHPGKAHHPPYDEMTAFLRGYVAGHKAPRFSY